MPERTKALDTLLAAQTEALTAAQLAKHFTKAKPAEIEEILETFQVMGWARKHPKTNTWWRTR